LVNGYSPTMTATAPLRWERLLLVAALVVGVLSMHATPVPCDAPAAHPTRMISLDAPGADAGHTPTAHGSGSEGCGGHHILAMCLAILITAVLLITVRTMWRRVAAVAAGGGRAPLRAAVACRAPPPRTAVRLAHLCVSRR